MRRHSALPFACKIFILEENNKAYPRVAELPRVKSSPHQTKPVGCVCVHSTCACEFLQFVCGWKLHRLFTTVIYIYLKIHQNFTALINPRQTYYRICEVMNSTLWKLHLVLQAAHGGQICPALVCENSALDGPNLDLRKNRPAHWMINVQSQERENSSPNASLHYLLDWTFKKGEIVLSDNIIALRIPGYEAPKES